MAIMRWCLDPHVLSAMEFEKFAKLVGGKNGKGSQNRLRSIWEKARDSIGCRVGEGAAYEAQVMVEGLKQIRAVIAETERKIESLCMEFPEYSCLLTIPGFGPDVSAKVLAAIGDPFRFENGKQVLKLAGWDLNAERSGQSSASACPVISKKGKAPLRYALYQAAFIASTKNREFVIYFTNKLRGREKEPGIKTKMRVKLAAKLLIIAWTLMKKKEVFRPDYLKIE